MTKRIFLGLVAFIASVGLFSSCNKFEDTVIEFSSLPSTAQTTISTHFDSEDIMLIIYDKELFDKEYTVTFYDGTVIEFDKSGNWDSIESYTEGVPTTIILTAIAEYLSEKYPDLKVVELDKDNNGYDVKLENKLELEFNTSGALVGVEMD